MWNAGKIAGPKTSTLFVHVVVWFHCTPLVQLDSNAVLAVELAVRKIWVSIDASLRSLGSRVEEVHSVNIRWGLFRTVEGDVSVKTASVPDASNKGAANERLTIIVYPLVLLGFSHHILQLQAFFSSKSSKFWNEQA